MRAVALAASLCLAAALFSAVHAETVSVIGRACVPNAFEPALPCTLRLDAPGDRLIGRGLRMFAEPEVRPDSNGEFAYMPFGADDFSFDQVNVFWHAQHFLERLERYGLDLEAFPIFLRVSPGAGSFTHFTEPVTTIGTGLNGQDRGAKDSDIIIHEITHAVFNPRLPLGPYPIDKGEASPMLEGLADYFAAAVNGDTRMGEFAKPPAGYHDIASDPAVYHYSRWDVLPADPYSRGKVLNGALLEIRSALGETTDELVFHALDHAPLRCLTCFADAVRWADDEHFAGAHTATIDAAFARRGIPSGPPIGVAIDTPAWAWMNEDFSVRLLHTCGAGPFEVTWRARDAQGIEVVLPSRSDQLTFRSPSPNVTLSATLRDRNGLEVAAPSRTVTAYDHSNPAFQVGSVLIVGPTAIRLGFRQIFTYSISGGAGIPPATTEWVVEGAQRFPAGPNGTGIEIVPFANPVRLRLTYRDAAGQSATDSLAVTVVPPLVAGPMSGPTVLLPGANGQYSVRAAGGVPPYHYIWNQHLDVQNFALPDSSSVASVPVSVNFQMSVSVVDAANQGSNASLNVRIVGPLGLGPIEGPVDLLAGRIGVFTARPQGGAAPIHYQWYQVGASTSYRLPDASIVTSVPVNEDFALQVIATDALGASASQSHLVRTMQALRLGTIEGPSSLFVGDVAEFSVRPQGGKPPYRFRWFQAGEGRFLELGDSSAVASLAMSRDFTITVTVRDSLDALAQGSKLLAVREAPPPPVARTFRVLGNVLRRGAHLVLELPTPDAPAEVEVLDTTGRLRASGRIPEGAGAQLALTLPGDLDSGIYFVRLKRSDRTWTARLVIIAG